MMPQAFQGPILFAALLFGALALTVIALYYVGQGLGVLRHCRKSLS